MPQAPVDGLAATALGQGWWTRALRSDERSQYSHQRAQHSDDPSEHSDEQAQGSDEDAPRGQGPTAGEPGARPSWAGLVEDAVAAATPPGPGSAGDGPNPWLAPLRPFLDHVRADLSAAAEGLPPGYADPELAAEAYAAAVGRQLADIARRTMEAELTRASAGSGQGERSDFMARLCTPSGLAAFLGQYPVLARLLGVATELAAEAGRELLGRFAADRASVVAELLGGVDPGPVVRVEPGLGDRHRGGRSATAVTFHDGRTVIYKPRDLAVHLAFRRIADWIGERVADELRLPAAVARPGYGWVEFIAEEPLPDPASAAEFYRREGMLLAALYATHACDMHSENIIASGTAPVLIDVETVFHPVLPLPRTTAADPAAEALASSVQSVGLLPNVTAGEDGAHDQSGMAGGNARNVPRLNGAVVEPDEHEAVILQGFRLAYDVIAAERAEFSGLLAACGDLEVRAVVRPTTGYARLLAESTHPGLMRDAADRDQALGVLHEVSAHHPLWRDLVEHEIADLWRGDIPLLTSRPARQDIWTSDGERLPDSVDQSGLSRALACVAAMGEVDRHDQEWIIAASLATRKPDGGHRGGRLVHGPVTAAAAEPGRLLAAACGLADQIMAGAIAAPDEPGGAQGVLTGRVNWLGLQLIEDTRWMLLPMGAGLTDGYLGVALFLAQLAEITGIDRYADAAWRAVGQVPWLLTAIGGQPELVAAIGCGADGLGGIGYGLARLSRLLRNPDMARWAGMAVEIAATAGTSGPAGWSAGSAGCLASMVAVHAELGLGPAADLAGACAERLRRLAEETDGRCGPADDQELPSFTSGPAGVGWALARFAETWPDARCLAASRLAARRAVEASPDDSAGWCSGAAGRLLARTCLPGPVGELGQQARALAGQPVHEDLSLCHGEAGIADVLTVLAALTKDRAAYRAQRHRAGLMLDLISRHEHVCGTPGGVSTPGLRSGLAGIGYGLLRLGFGDRVPSALLLQASQPTKLFSR